MENYSFLFKIIKIKKEANFEISNEKLFFKIWRNKYILNEINYHLRLYNLNYKKKFENCQILYEFIYKDYVKDLTLIGIDENIFNEQFKIPCGILKLSLPNFNREFNIPNIIPSTVIHLKFGDRFNKLLKPGNIPNSIKYLEFGENFNQPLTDTGVIPSSVETIKFGNFNQILKKNDIPFGVRSIEFGSHFDKPINNLPWSITSIKFGNRYGKPFDATSLPLLLTTISGFSSKEPLKNYNIPSVTYLQFDNFYSHKLELDTLPNGLLHLDLSNVVASNFSIEKGVLPKTLQTLKLPFGYSRTLVSGTLPPDLKTLYCYCDSNFKFEGDDVFPSSITDLRFGNDFSQHLNKGTLPSNLRYLELGRCGQPLLNDLLPRKLESLKFVVFNQKIELNQFPNSLKEITFSYDFQQILDINVLPNQLVKLNLGGYNHSLEKGTIPNSVKILKFESFNQILKVGDLPNSLTSLEFEKFDHPIQSNVLPVGLKTLIFDDFNSNFEIDSLPNTLTFLKFNKYKQLIKPGSLPNSIEILNLGYYFNQPLKDIIPSSIISLKLNNSFFYQELKDLPNTLLILYINKIKMDSLLSTIQTKNLIVIKK
ncbi:hypothetical protein RB653_004290 [Dictyostelium firmibasis]|uniref:FNIP repeat-containing protein n=1 Tax=Dictyostelium firmibasis TaxID=79012 RepID=A0AAN7UA96_9MYCE